MHLGENSWVIILREAQLRVIRLLYKDIIAPLVVCNLYDIRYDVLNLKNMYI